MTVLALILLGVCLGSFVNALVWRLHEQDRLKSRKRTAKQAKDLSIVYGRSMCTHCKHTLSAKDLLPIVSWVALGGKCRYCHKKIEDNPLAEVITAALFVFSYAYWPLGFDNRGWTLFAFWLVFLVGFVAMVIYDIRWYMLPDRIVYPLLGLAMVQVFVTTVFLHGGAGEIKQAIFGILIGGGIFYVLFQVSSGKWIGGGDVKLGAVLGLIVGGPWEAFLLLFAASCLGSIVAIPLLLSGRIKRGAKLPFGPFLIAGAVFVYLFGASIIAWYKSQLLL